MQKNCSNNDLKNKMSSDICEERERMKTVNLYKYEIPIPDYYGDGVHSQELYFKGEVCPTWDQVMQAVKLLHERDSRYEEYLGCWVNVEKVLLDCKDDFPRLGGCLCQKNIFVQTPWVSEGKPKRHSLTVKLVRPVIVSDDKISIWDIK